LGVSGVQSIKKVGKWYAVLLDQIFACYAFFQWKPLFMLLCQRPASFGGCLLYFLRKSMWYISISVWYIFRVTDVRCQVVSKFWLEIFKWTRSGILTGSCLHLYDNPMFPLPCLNFRSPCWHITLPVLHRLQSRKWRKNITLGRSASTSVK
jgi:hypothetical protein